MVFEKVYAQVNDPDENEEEEEEVEEEEPVDPQDTLKDEKAGDCTKYQNELDACSERVASRSNTEETCEQELYDFLHCRDCKVAKTLFSQLK